MIFNWLYRRRVRKFLAGVIPAESIEQILPTKLSEGQALKSLLQIILPEWLLPRIDRNTLVAIRNQMLPALGEIERRERMTSKPDQTTLDDRKP